MKAAILAGGYGKRLRPLTNKIPKNMVPINRKPIIIWQIEWLRKYGVDEFVLLTGYLGDILEKEIGDGRDIGVHINYCREYEPLGTGGAVLNGMEYLKDEEIFFVVNGDVLTNLDLREMTLLDKDLIGGLALVPLPSPYGIIEIDRAGFIRRFIEKPLIYDKWINGGVYVFRREIFNYLPQKGSIEHDTFPTLAEKGLLKGFIYRDVFWMSIDSHKDIEEASKRLSKLAGWP
jgi:NDP-sugar pyrophosphorylase family protein